MNISQPKYITFGKYFQSDAERKEPVEWLVMDGIFFSEKYVLLLSRYAIDCKTFNETSENIGWEVCTLRKWLNDEFLNSAFSDEEREAIIAGGKPDRKTDIGLYERESAEVAEDRIFLLSETEAYLYFQDSVAGRCRSTPYAIQNGAGEWCNSDGFCRWGLRTRDYFITVCSISAEGQRCHGRPVNLKYPIRPAMWISVETFKKLCPDQNISDRHPVPIGWDSELVREPEHIKNPALPEPPTVKSSDERKKAFEALFHVSLFGVLRAVIIAILFVAFCMLWK